MPIRGTTNVPKSDSSIKDLSRYLNDFDQHADNAGIAGQARIKAVLRYISRDDAETWETLAEATAGDYDAFVKAVKELYPSCDAKPDYSKNDLEYVVAKQVKRPMYSIEDFGQYDRTFH